VETPSRPPPDNPCSLEFETHPWSLLLGASSWGEPSMSMRSQGEIEEDDVEGKA
jgi:hypothetical protein